MKSSFHALTFLLATLCIVALTRLAFEENSRRCQAPSSADQFTSVCTRENRALALANCAVLAAGIVVMMTGLIIVSAPTLSPGGSGTGRDAI